MCSKTERHNPVRLSEFRKRHFYSQWIRLATYRNRNVYEFTLLDGLRYHPADPFYYPDGRDRRGCFNRFSFPIRRI